MSMSVPPRLAARLELAYERHEARGFHAKTILVCELTGKAWAADTFRHRFAQVREAAAAARPSIADAWFMDLRDTSVTTLALAGSTIPEICAVTGHSETSAHQVLKHYLALNSEMADSAIAKLLAYEERRATEGSESQYFCAIIGLSQLPDSWQRRGYAPNHYGHS